MSAAAPPLQSVPAADLAERLRTPFLFAAGVLIVLALLFELGGVAIRPQFGPDEQAEFTRQTTQLNDAAAYTADQLSGQSQPGLGIPALALVDAVVVFTMALTIAGVLFPESLTGRVQGIATLVFSILLILAAIAAIFFAIGKLLLMIALLLAFPFGPLVYLALFGFFARTAAAAALSVLMTLKLAFAVCLVIAHQRFLQNLGLVLLVATSLVADIIVSFLHGLVPRFLASITDAVAAIVVGVLAVIWAIVLLVGSIPAILKALRPAR
jgi:hypothetical protein